MDIGDLKSFLRLQVVRKAEQLFELKVTASNGRYFGTTEVFDSSEPILKFAHTLLGFPQDNNDLLYETGVKKGYASFSMHFYCIDNSEHIGVEIKLEDKVRTEFSHEEKNKIKIEIIVEPKAVGHFQNELSQLASKKEGIAILHGIDSAVSNKSN